MTNRYGAAAGHDQTPTAFSLQPASQGPQYPEAVFALDGAVYDEGTPFIDLVWAGDIQLADALTMLAQCGLVTLSGGVPTAVSSTAAVTVRIPVHELRRGVFDDINGVAILPRAALGLKHRRLMNTYTDLTVRVTALEL